MKNKKNKHVFVWANYQSLLTLEINLEAIAYHRKNEWNLINNFVEISQNNNIKCFHGARDLQNDRVRGKKFLNKKYGKRFLKSVDDNYKKTWKLFRKFKIINYQKLSNQKLLVLMEEAKNNWMGQIATFRALQEDGTSMLVREVEKNFSKEEMMIIMHPTQKDITGVESSEWHNMIIKNNKISDKLLLNHADRFPWLVAAHFNISDVLSSLRSRLKMKSLANSNLSDKDKIFFKKEQKKILSKTSKKVKDYVDLIHKLGLARMKIKSCWSGLDYYLIPLINEIAKRTGERVMDINRYYITDDIKRLLLTSKKVSQEEKKRRQFCFVGVWKDNKLSFKSGQPALAMARYELGNLLVKKETKELKGAVANPGKARAMARILFSNNIESTKKIRREFKKGQLLVTQMTQPNIFDIAKKAGAIITDEGGLLSHAAIISRELKIPCIVGTKVATEVLHDGDFVEVDANNGVVKIIKRA